MELTPIADISPIDAASPVDASLEASVIKDGLMNSASISPKPQSSGHLDQKKYIKFAIDEQLEKQIEERQSRQIN